MICVVQYLPPNKPKTEKIKNKTEIPLLNQKKKKIEKNIKSPTLRVVHMDGAILWVYNLTYNQLYEVLVIV